MNPLPSLLSGPQAWSLVDGVSIIAILVQLPFTLEAGAYSVPAEYQREALPLLSHFFTKPADRLRIKILRPRSSALFWNFLCSTPPSSRHLMPAVYKLMNSLPATHLKTLSCLLKGDKMILFVMLSLKEIVMGRKFRVLSQVV